MLSSASVPVSVAKNLSDPFYFSLTNNEATSKKKESLAGVQTAWGRINCAGGMRPSSKQDKDTRILYTVLR